MNAQVSRKQSAQSSSKEVVPVIQNVNNSPDLLSMGIQAIKLINEGDSKRGKGISIMTYVIAQALYTKTFETIVNGPQSFTLEDIITGRGLIKSDGKSDNKLSKARLNVIARDLFGIQSRVITDMKTGKEKSEFFNASQVNSFKKALNLCANLIKLRVRMDTQVQLSEDNILMLPQCIFFGEPTNTHLKAVYLKTKHDVMPINSYEDMLRNVDKLLLAEGHKAKRGTKAKTPQEKFTDNLNEVAKDARELAIKIHKGEDGISPTERNKLMNAYNAIKMALDAMDKAEAASEAANTYKTPAKKTA